MLLDSILGSAPSIILEPRALFEMKSQVPIEKYRTPFGRSNVVATGDSLTLVSFGNEFQICRRALEALPENVVELIDLTSIKPLDMSTIIKSVKKTGSLMVVEGVWRTYSVGGEIVAQTCEALGPLLHKPPVRLCYPDSHTPASTALEDSFYISEQDVRDSIRKLLDI